MAAGPLSFRLSDLNVSLAFGSGATLQCTVVTCSNREEVSSFFEQMDRDYDGKLSFSEFMGEETPLEQLFRSMDREGNGSITKQVSSVQFNHHSFTLSWLGSSRPLGKSKANLCIRETITFGSKLDV